MKKEQKQKRKMKKGVKRALIIILILILAVLIGMYLYKNFSGKKPVNTKVKVIDEISEYGYKLEENETKLYKDLFKELSEVLSKEEVDKKKYAELLAKLYIADFYNLDNKVTKNDVGALQFIHKDAVENFTLKAKDTMYKNIESNIYGDRKQELPIVKSIGEASVEESKFTLNKESVTSYVVTINWKYEKDLGYDYEKKITIISEDDKKLGIVETSSVDK